MTLHKNFQPIVCTLSDSRKRQTFRRRIVRFRDWRLSNWLPTIIRPTDLTDIILSVLTFFAYSTWCMVKSISKRGAAAIRTPAAVRRTAATKRDVKRVCIVFDFFLSMRPLSKNNRSIKRVIPLIFPSDLTPTTRVQCTTNSAAWLRLVCLLTDFRFKVHTIFENSSVPGVRKISS